MVSLNSLLVQLVVFVSKDIFIYSFCSTNEKVLDETKYFLVECQICYTYFFVDKKLRIWASTESFLKLSDFEYSEFLMSFLKVPVLKETVFMFPYFALLRFSKQCFFDNFSIFRHHSSSFLVI